MSNCDSEDLSLLRCDVMPSDVLPPSSGVVRLSGLIIEAETRLDTPVHVYQASRRLKAEYDDLHNRR